MLNALVGFLIRRRVLLLAIVILLTAGAAWLALQAFRAS